MKAKAKQTPKRKKPAPEAPKPKPQRREKYSFAQLAATPIQERKNIGRQTGRNPTINDAAIESVARYMRLGNYFETACHLTGISMWTARDWMLRGLASLKGVHMHTDELAEKFYLAVKEAESYSEMQDVAVVTLAARNGDWKAASWRLERKFPERWGQRLSLDADIKHSTETGAPVQVSAMNEDERRQRLRELEAKRNAITVTCTKS